MADTAGLPESGDDAAGRRDFLILATCAVGAVGAASFVWPLVHSMNPSAEVLALSTVEIDLSPIEVGQSITVVWQGKPVFVRHRTAKEIAAAVKRHFSTWSIPTSMRCDSTSRSVSRFDEK